ncbi:MULTISPECIES: hypothetical protein [unclassified Bradyrhizobium]|uniref:hypothetical protein n=1 Tax=unclassified Bradyrhizobium TaxID=2631580 RepID=UPI0029167FE8|nr:MULTISPECIES: hypothetical protein [unclassified Bradyrhizobium]
MAIETLPLPFQSWREGLLGLADGLRDPTRERIIVARLEATAKGIKIGPREIYSLALLVPARPRLERFDKPEPPPEIARLAKAINANGELDRTVVGIVDNLERIREDQRQKVFKAFPDGDPRRLLNDTIFGSAAAELSDVSRRLGEADPFSRLAVRLSLWFRGFDDYSRFGLSLPHDGSAVMDLVCGLAKNLESSEAENIRALIGFWSGENEISLGREGIEALTALLPPPHKHHHADYLDVLLVLEILGSLAGESEEFDVETAKEFSRALEWLPRRLNDGRPRTADLIAWLDTLEPGGDNRFRLVYDPGSAFSSAVFSDQADLFLPLLGATIELMNQAGHSVFPTGPLPMCGNMFGERREMRVLLKEKAPEAANLFRLIAIGGDRDELYGPHPPQSLWTGDHDPDAITFPEAIEHAGERGDFALSDMLIGGWLLFCTLYRREPLPDLIGLARLITRLPIDHRSSTYAVLGALKREAAEIPQLRRDVDGILSWLPLVETASSEDFETILRETFSPAHWQALTIKEQTGLIEAEGLFVRMRRMRPSERELHPMDASITRWSRVAEPILRRLLSAMSGTAVKPKALGILVVETKKIVDVRSGSWSAGERNRYRLLPAALHELDRLDLINKKGVKHSDGLELTWAHVVEIHTGVHWTMRALVEATAPAPAPPTG